KGKEKGGEAWKSRVGWMSLRSMWKCGGVEMIVVVLGGILVGNFYSNGPHQLISKSSQLPSCIPMVQSVLLWLNW
ncbi:MAG TPA: hypothetical protein PLJ43_09750, partial [Chitinophagales bacterium]|nr:hypothetical protein [Chitinophagales bacterium]